MCSASPGSTAAEDSSSPWSRLLALSQVLLWAKKAKAGLKTPTGFRTRPRLLPKSPETECLFCHPPPLYTDLHVHDVGTADAYGEWFGPLIDTPTLRFLYDSAPYLHDGSAATLYELLVIKNPQDEHGVTSHLTEQQIEDLISFLLALPVGQE